MTKADRLAVRSLPQNCFKQVWPDFATACLRTSGSEAKIIEARLVTAVARRDARRTNSLEIIMTNPAHQSDVQINRIHSSAICKEMGERLSARLGPQSNELPARLLALMEQLEKVEHRDSSAN